LLETVRLLVYLNVPPLRLPGSDHLGGSFFLNTYSLGNSSWRIFRSSLGGAQRVIFFPSGTS
jgi:hypothetical protein